MLHESIYHVHNPSSHDIILTHSVLYTVHTLFPLDPSQYCALTLCLRLPSSHSLSGLLTKILYKLLISLMHATCPTLNHP